jgi:hypothetical protein
MLTTHDPDEAAAEAESRRDLCHQVLEQVSVRVMVYAGISGCRVICFLRKLA